MELSFGSSQISRNLRPLMSVAVSLAGLAPVVEALASAEGPRPMAFTARSWKRKLCGWGSGVTVWRTVPAPLPAMSCQPCQAPAK